MITPSGTRFAHAMDVTARPPYGEGFDFDDEQEMRRRLPRLSTLFLGTSAT